jgi:hypothetical protein
VTWNLIVSPLELLKSRHNRLFLGNKGPPGGDRDLVGVAARIMVAVLVLKVVAKVIVVSCVGLFFARHDLGQAGGGGRGRAVLVDLGLRYQHHQTFHNETDMCAPMRWLAQTYGTSMG